MAFFVARLVALVAALALLFVCAGCEEHLVGTNDVALDYRATRDDDATEVAKPSAVLASNVTGRLGAAHVTADVDVAADGTLHIVVDRDAAETVDALLTWRGGLAIYELETATSYTPDDTTGLTAETEAHPEGYVERYFTGSPEAVAAAIRRSKAPEGLRALVEIQSPESARTRLVKDPPRLDLRGAIDRVETRRGRTLVAHVNAAGAAKLADVAREAGDAPLVIARDRSALAIGPLVLERGALIVPFASDLYAYARAHQTKLLVASPVLPRLARAHAAALPTNLPLAIACVVIPMILSFAWIFFVRRFDRAHPEPMWMILATFALGGLSVIPAALAEYGFMRLSPYLNPTLMTLGGQIVAFPVALAVFTLTVGLSEEGSKLLGAWTLAYHRREFDEPVDGIIYGAVSALGFAAVENVKYFALGRMSPVLIIVRTFMSIPAHMFFGAIWGYALGRKLVDRRTSLLGFLALSALAHGAFDTFLSIDGMGALALVLNVGLASLFIVFLRRALRHGPMHPDMARIPAEHRALYQLGSPGAFTASAIAMHVLALVVFVLGVYMEVQHRRVGFGFVGAMSTFITLLGLSAYFLSLTIPLDVAIDDHGVTFGGAVRPWSGIRGIERAHRALRLRSMDGDILLGPGSPATLDRLAFALDTRLTQARAPA
jgi:RsiW-degrading membrane proteinase PrsW (M82 family)